MKSVLEAIFKRRRKLPAVKGTLGDKRIFSDYVLNRLRNTRWEDRGTILDLIEIEQHVLGGTRTASAARARSYLQRQYPDETSAITAELITPDELVERAKRNAKKEEAAQRSRAKEQARAKEVEDRKRQQWQNLGGRP